MNSLINLNTLCCEIGSLAGHGLVSMKLAHPPLPSPVKPSATISVLNLLGSDFERR